VCLGCRQTPARRQPLESTRGAEQSTGEPGAAGIRHKPDADERGHERRVLRGDAHVARKRK